MEELKELYNRLEETDRQIVELIRRHLEQAEEISRFKIDHGLRMIDKQADRSMAERLCQEVNASLEKTGTGEILSQLQSVARKRQYQILEERSVTGRLPFIEVDHLDRDHIRVVYQGVEGAYSHAAMCRFFSEDVSSFHVDQWREAMEAIADGEADYAVLPIENSSAGIVADNYDLLVSFENYIVGEQVIQCEHALLGTSDSSLDGITVVYSHPQALSQCSQFLEEHDGWELIPFANTAMAARKVAADGNKAHAAIASEFAGKRFGLKVLADHIYYNQANSTRFIIVTNQRIFCRDASRISICFELPHRSGALYSILSHFIYNGLNMTRIESRPITGRNWEYRFFIDFDGNLRESRVRSALRGIRSDAINLKILGNY